MVGLTVRNWVIGAVLSVVLGGLSATNVSAAPASGDDGWRRTAEGWQNIHQSRVDAASGGHHYRFELDPANTSTWRLDSHPAALVVVQLLAVGVAFFYFPGLRGRTSSQLQSVLA